MLPEELTPELDEALADELAPELEAPPDEDGPPAEDAAPDELAGGFDDAAPDDAGLELDAGGGGGGCGHLLRNRFISLAALPQRALLGVPSSQNPSLGGTGGTALGSPGLPPNDSQSALY